MTDFRVTLRSADVELRGVVRGDGCLTALAKAVEPLNIMVIASIDKGVVPDE